MQLHYPREEVLAVYVNEVNRPDLAAEIFADSLGYPSRSSPGASENDPARADLADGIRAPSQAVLTAEVQNQTPRFSARGYGRSLAETG